MTTKWMMDPALQELYNLQRLCKGKTVDAEIKRGIDKAIELINDRDEYCERVSSEPSPALKSLAKGTETHPFDEACRAGKVSWNMQPWLMSDFLQGNFLQTIVSQSKAKRVLELGMFTGFAALACAEALPEDGEVVTCEVEPYLEGVARSFFNKSPHGKKIQIRIGPAKETLLTLTKEKQTFDVVFMDANKDEQIEYYQIIMQNGLLAKGGTLMIDNALMAGEVYRRGSKDYTGRSVRECNAFIQEQQNIHKVLIPMRDGVLMIRRKEDTFGPS